MDPAVCRNKVDNHSVASFLSCSSICGPQQQHIRQQIALSFEDSHHLNDNVVVTARYSTIFPHPHRTLPHSHRGRWEGKWLHKSSTTTTTTTITKIPMDLPVQSRHMDAGMVAARNVSIVPWEFLLELDWHFITESRMRWHVICFRNPFEVRLFSQSID